MDHTSVANMSELFVKAKDELLFVKKHLKLTHCDIFFADGVIFVEGQAERLLVPEFISNSFPGLSNRYISMLEVSGAHTHKYRELVEKLGVATLVLTDLDSVDSKGKSCFPQKGSAQKSSNNTLKKWHPKKEFVDELISLPQGELATTSESAPLYVAYQCPTNIGGEGILSRTFEDALILANIDRRYFQKKLNVKVVNAVFQIHQKYRCDKAKAKLQRRRYKKINTSRNVIKNTRKNNSQVTKICVNRYKNKFAVERGYYARRGNIITESLYDYVKNLKKGDFAFDCLFYLADNEANSFNPPEYMSNGFTWLEKQLSPKG
jgi:hypothetical protein